MSNRRLALFASTALAAATLSQPATAATPAEVVTTYADIAEAAYGDSLTAAIGLQGAVEALIAAPSEQSLAAARAAWIAARPSYQQTEVYRFGNAIVDDWEGRGNAWPLGEGLVDYVAGGYGTESADNELYTANVIANTTLTIGGKKLNTAKITKELLA